MKEKSRMLIKYWVNIFLILKCSGSSVQPQLCLVSHLFIYRESKNIVSFNEKIRGKTNIWIIKIKDAQHGEILALYLHASLQVLQQNIHFHETLLVSWKLFTHNCTEAKVRPLSYQEESRVKSEQNF